MYVGSIDTTEDLRWLYNSTSEKMEYKKLMFNPCLYKLVDELLVNSIDEKVRSGNVKQIDVNCGLVDNIYTITIKNDGNGISTDFSKEKNDKGELIYTPELIFGHLLT